MRRSVALACLLYVAPLCAQAPAVQDADRVQALVAAGALPRTALQDAEQMRAEAVDEAVLRRTLYGVIPVEELTEEQAEEMLAAAQRLLDHQKQKVEHAKRLVEEGVMARLSLTPYLEELDRRRRTFDLADSRARLLRELAEMVRAEQALQITLEKAPEEAPKIAERYDGDGIFRMSQLQTISDAFQRHFAQPLPISARGATALHRALGFDHRGRVDVAVSPDTPQGVWLRRLLENLHVPYFAFRSFVPGKSTAPHIHIGPPSGHLASN
jgi:hypothetical protein